MLYTNTEHDMAGDELDQAHQAFLAEIVHLDGKAAQQLFKTIAEDREDTAPALSSDMHHAASAR